MRRCLPGGLFCLLIFTLLVLSTPSAHAQAGYKLIAHPGVPQTSLKKEDVSKIFFKKMKKWDGSNVSVEPFDLGASSRVREAFTEDVHGRKVKAIEDYWQRQIFSGRGLPPKEATDEDQMLQWVATTEGAIGYVSPTKEVTDSSGRTLVKVLTIAP